MMLFNRCARKARFAEDGTVKTDDPRKSYCPSCFRTLGRFGRLFSTYAREFHSGGCALTFATLARYAAACGKKISLM